MSIPTISACVDAAQDKMEYYRQAVEETTTFLREVLAHLQELEDKKGDAESTYEYLKYVQECAEEAADSAEEEAYNGEDTDFPDIRVQAKERKTRAHIMTPTQAFHTGKVHKTHKLKPRDIKRDRTKTKEAKDHTKAMRFSHACAV